MSRARDLLLGAAGAAGTALTWSLLRGRVARGRALREGDLRGAGDHGGWDPSWTHRWERTNHAGAQVTLLEGVALVVGTAGTAVVTAGAWGGRGAPARALPFAVASLGAGALGALDDLRQDTDRKGLAGHLRALASGRVTTGAVKIIGLGATGLAAVLWQDRWAPVAPSGAARVWSTLAGGAVVAGSANLANLFDLRPGRALKVGALTAVPLVLTGPGSPGAALTLGAVAAVLPDDLAGRSMLGDTGANPLGAMLGLALVARQGTVARTICLGVVTGLTLASERVSFTRVIETTPVLRELDALGRQRRPGAHRE